MNNPGAEYFDLVDENDQVTGRALRRDVHANGWRHRAVHILAFDRRGEVFLQLRSLKKDMAPGLWDSSCSGHVDSGEDYDAAAQRELGEELGLRLSHPPARWFRIEAGPKTGWEFVWVYRIGTEGPFDLNPEEIQRGEWVMPAELDSRIAAKPGDYSAAFRFIWGRARDRM
ncbi:MAG TPA: NUDIX domain-containing protein [Candidatus Didemnitutus sp.]|nr:NUDIX domain-containing protein [Candidatus Didemnitutus sp.]